MSENIVQQRIAQHGQPICMEPWYNLFLGYDGTTKTCCFQKGHMGKIGKDGESLLDVWNSGPACEFRQNMLDGKIHDICTSHCVLKNRPAGIIKKIPVHPAQNPIFDGNLALVNKEFEEGKTCLRSFPLVLGIAWTNRCNLQCIMCSSWGDNVYEQHKLQAEDLRTLFPYLKELTILGGEPLVEKSCIDFIQQFSHDKFPCGRVNLMTNGLLLTPRVLERIKRTEFYKIVISVDAVTSATYSRIRKGGDFSKLVENIKHLSERADKEHFVAYIGFNFLIMTENFRELPLLPAFIRSLGPNIQPRLYPVRNQPRLAVENHPELQDEFLQCVGRMEDELVLHGFDRDIGQTQLINAMPHQLAESVL